MSLDALKTVTLDIQNRRYDVPITVSLIFDIEQELGSFSALSHSFMSDKWRISDLTTLIHMMMSSIGVDVDYYKLGHQILSSGVHDYKMQILAFLSDIILKK